MTRKGNGFRIRSAPPGTGDKLREAGLDWEKDSMRRDEDCYDVISSGYVGLHI